MNHDKIPLNPPFSKGEVFLLPLVSDPERSLSELECSPSRKLTRRAKGGGEGFYEAFFKALKCYLFTNSSLMI